MPSDRQGFKEYCLRNLGAPVLEINVDDDQIEDRIDEAIEHWRLYHPEGIEKMYLKHQIKASVLNLQEPIADTFIVSKKVTGLTSGATAFVTFQSDKRSSGTELLVYRVNGDFAAGETILYDDGNGVTITATLALTNHVVLGEVDLKYIELPDYIYGVVRVLPFAGTQTSKSMFDIQYQLRLNDLYDLASTSLIYYKMVMSHLSMLDLELNGKPQIRFNRMMGRLQLDINWDADVIPGDYVVIDCYRALDPSTWSRVWNEPWLKHYTTALIKRQWATNLKKFSGLQLPGGVSLDGQALYQEAMQEMKELEDELMTKSAPLDFYMG